MRIDEENIYKNVTYNAAGYDVGPNLDYLLETKADILYSYGYSDESLKFYKKIIKSYPNNHYVKKRIFDIT